LGWKKSVFPNKLQNGFVGGLHFGKVNSLDKGTEWGLDVVKQVRKSDFCVFFGVIFSINKKT
jgi:hypothetical protein